MRKVLIVAGIIVLVLILLFVVTRLVIDSMLTGAPPQKPDFKYLSSRLIEPGVWQIIDGTDEKPVYADIYLVEGSDRALVIDAGISKSDLPAFVSTLTQKPFDLVLTHGHGDHTAAAPYFQSVYMSSKDFDLIKPKHPNRISRLRASRA